MKRLPAHARPLPLVARSHSATRSPAGWHAYLVLAVALAPLCVPTLPGNSAALDFLNVAALAVFGFVLLSPGRRMHTPLLVPIAMIAAGSLLATFGAPSPARAALSVAQDVYLFVWFVALVNLLRGERDVRLACIVWTASAVIVSGVAVIQLYAYYGSLDTLLGSRGMRPTSTFYNPNMLADYLVISLFLGTSLFGQVRRRILLPALGLILVGLISTKSNGGMLSFAAGAFVWLMVTAAVSHVNPARLVAGLLLLAGLAGLGVWAHREWGLGDAQLLALQKHTFAGRLEHSSESRMRIMDQLERAYMRNPLGIGPGNSGALTVSISERQRPDSYQAKEAHSDYLAYAIERGPVGLAGLLALTGVLFAQVYGTWQNRPHAAARQRRAGRWVAAASGALAASAAHSLTIEKLHFRHYWLLVALVCASALFAARHAERRRARQELTQREAEHETLPVVRPARGRLRPAGLLRRVTA